MAETDSTENSTPSEPALQYLLVALGNQEYGVRLDFLQAVRRYEPEQTTPVPNTPFWLDGVLNVRGSIISAVNLRLYLNLPRAESDDSFSARLGIDLGIGFGRPIPRLLLAFKDQLVIGFVVDDIKGVVFVQPALINRGLADATVPDTIRPYVEGIYRDPETGRTTNLLDIRKLMTTPQILQFEPLEFVS